MEGLERGAREHLVSKIDNWLAFYGYVADSD